MRIPFLSLFLTSPFDGLLEHSEKVRECGWAFQQAIECYASEQCKAFEEYRQEVDRLESEADAIKRRIRGHITVRTRMPDNDFPSSTTIPSFSFKGIWLSGMRIVRVLSETPDS